MQGAERPQTSKPRKSEPQTSRTTGGALVVEELWAQKAPLLRGMSNWETSEQLPACMRNASLPFLLRGLENRTFAHCSSVRQTPAKKHLSLRAETLVCMIARQHRRGPSPTTRTSQGELSRCRFTRKPEDLMVLVCFGRLPSDVLPRYRCT
jgi:hypothetical protein